MPILQIELVTEEGERLRPGLAAALADAAGEVLRTPRGRTWVRLRALPRTRYAESGGPPPKGVRPVFVSLLKARAASQRARLREAALLCAAIARVCRRPVESVHLFYEPPAAGRAAFGGDLLEA